MTYRDFEIPLVLQTDVSDYGLRAVLTQTQNGAGLERVIAFASMTMSNAEEKYSVRPKECLAVIWSIRKFSHYLEGSHFAVITDHSSLRWLETFTIQPVDWRDRHLASSNTILRLYTEKELCTTCMT